MLVDHPELEGSPLSNQPFICRLIWKNTGKTPALSAYGFIQISFGSAAYTQDKNYFLETAKLIAAPMSIGSGGTMPVFSHCDRPLPETALADLRTGKRTYYISGIIIYTDIFSHKHASYFSSRYAAKANAVQVLPNGNDAD